MCIEQFLNCPYNQGFYKTAKLSSSPLPRMMELHSKLGKYEMSLDMAYLAKLMRVVLFHKYLSNYAE